MEPLQGDQLINESIKRILLDIVIRGHGDRLIVRWSRQPELQEFLEQVPYMLDRINQLHLACTRSESLDSRHLHHFHHQRQQDGQQQTSINDFIGLIGPDMHWLVRTRDTMGLTPLHKAVLHCNRPIVEYILDRYQGELAACVWRSGAQIGPKHAPQSQMRLIDAQDKYGRSALHYAAALLSSDHTKHAQRPTASHIYHLLIEKGASLTVRDFRGANPAYYARHPNQLRSKSIIHLASKLNANFQANVLAKTLQAASKNAPINEPLVGAAATNSNSATMPFEQFVDVEIAPEHDRVSMSVSCHDLRSQEPLDEPHLDSTSGKQHLPEVNYLAKRSKSSIGSPEGGADEERDLASLFGNGQADLKPQPMRSVNYEEQQPNNNRSSIAASPPESLASDELANEVDKSLKWLVGERCSRLVLDRQTKQTVKRCLSEGVVSKITELLVDGHGSYIMSEAATICWNQHCKRYIYNVIPILLAKLDTLHELIATNQFLAFKTMLNEEPILARIKRPYRRAALNALHLAVQLNRKRMVKFLVSRYPELVSQLDSQGATCLHWAAKSLEREQIYFWLLEHFGHQLEQISDSRAKLAADYRQQAIRMAKSGVGSSLLVDRNSGAPELMRKIQVDSDKLQFVGKRCTLNNRRKPPPIGSPPPIDTNKGSSSASGISINASDTLEKSIEIGLDEFSSTMGREDDLFGRSSFSELPIGKQSKSYENQSSLEGADPTAQSRAVGSHQSDRRNSDAARGQPEGHCQTNNTKAREVNTDDDKSIKNENSLSQNLLLSEMVQLDSEDFTSGDQIFINSDDTRQSNVEAVENEEAASREASPRPTSGLKLDTIIWESIVGNDFKKLEHLILAGCGGRLLDVFQERYSSLSSDAPKVSEEMRSFFKTRVPSYIENTLKIHQVLHTCYAGARIPTVDLNSSFHKLCNLLSRMSFIMCRDSFGATPLHVALVRSDKRLVDYLVRRQPEVASAPDHQNRTAFHYAALTLAAYKHHGKFKLATGGDSARGGYWLVDETSGRIYENLRSRYAELLEVKDKCGLTCSDYLELAANAHEIRSTLQETGSEQPSIEKCCPEYAKLFARYGYVFVQETSWLSPTNATRDDEKEETGVKRSAEFVVGPSHISGRQRSLQRSCSCETSEDTKRPAKRKDGGSSQRSHTADDLLKHLDGELLLPAAFVPPDASIVRQVAPKPTVGCSTGFHHMPPSPTSVDRQLESGRSSANESRSKLHHHHHHRRHKARTLLDDLNPNQQPSPTHHRHHHHHHHHHHHRHHNRAARRSPNAIYQSVVGGVIVPTIIHNDKMDEIETYDIIYRPPPAASQANSESSFSSSSSDGAEEEEAAYKGQKDGVSKISAKELDGRDKSSHSSSSSDTIDLNDERDYDVRVERLSNEFENRVRREKSELRAKVDQIMSEIRMSSKLEPTTSPRGGSTKNEEATSQQHTSTSSKTTVNSVLIGQVAGGDKPSAIGQSLPSSAGSSSSGHSSAKAASSSGSSLCSSNAAPSCSSRSPTVTSFSSSASSCASTTKTSASDHSGGKSSVKPKSPSSQLTNGTKPEETAAIEMSQKRPESPKVPSSLADQVNQVLSKNTYGQTYLHFIASRSQSPSILYKVLAHGSHLIGERDIFYRTARDVAVQFNLPNNVQILDKFIIDLFIEGKTSLLRHLLNQGYSPLIHVTDPDGNDIMLILKLLKLDRVIHFLLQMADFQRWRDELHTFIRHGYSAGVSELIKKHADLVRAKSIHSRTSLHLAVLFDRVDMVKELLDIDPGSVHEADNMGRTALHYIYGLNLNNMDEIRDKLMVCGASLEARDAKMRTPKYYFVFKREIEDIKRIELELN